MAIKKRMVPEPEIIKDYRGESGIYYEAECDQCGRTYYPKRSTSKYCSKICTIEHAKGNIVVNKFSKGGSISKKKSAEKPKKESFKERQERVKRLLEKYRKK